MLKYSLQNLKAKVYLMKKFLTKDSDKSIKLLNTVYNVICINEHIEPSGVQTGPHKFKGPYSERLGGPVLVAVPCAEIHN